MTYIVVVHTTIGYIAMAHTVMAYILSAGVIGRCANTFLNACLHACM